MQPFHYSTHAAELFTQLAVEFRQSLPRYDELETLLASWLDRAVVFQLPDNGILFADRDYRPEFLDLVRLPFPMIAIEFKANDLLFVEDAGLHRADKRIALAFSLADLPGAELRMLEWVTKATTLRNYPREAIAIMSVYAPNDCAGTPAAWGCSPGFVVLNPLEAPPRLAAEVAMPPVPEWAKSRRTTKHALEVDIFPFVTRAMLIGQTPTQAQDSTVNDTIDELSSTWELLVALNCNNVGVGKEAPPAALNKKRTKQGKRPFKETNFLDIALDQGRAGVRTGEGGHAAPRPHLRRGHLRRLPEVENRPAKVVWVNATQVGGGPATRKPYRVRA